MKKLGLLFVIIWCPELQAQNQLFIPPALTGTSFNLTVQAGSQIFYGTSATPTYGINGSWMAPTVIVNKGDSITLNVINNLPVITTMHWHGLHVAAVNDGGPHQEINPGTTWSPSFEVRNNASTYWYHPHGAGQTEQQISKGLAGMLIVKDNAEAQLALPRTYGTDDFPVILQTKAFDVLQQIAIATDMDTSLFVNGTLSAYLVAPGQVIRLRLLNASSLRSFNIGLSNGQTFYQIATDGGMRDSSLALTRLKISPGERAEILLNLTGMTGQIVYLRNYGSELPTGIYGADTVGTGPDTIPEYESNFLNGVDFDLLKLNIYPSTVGAITSIPPSLIPYTPLDTALATVSRTIVMDTIRHLPIDIPNLAEGPFALNYEIFNIDSINEIVYLNTTEICTLVNKTLIAHPFHIHDVQFNVIEKSGVPPVPEERGWKDVILVMPNDSVKFIAKFETFADNMTPYMYHCHLLHHEDDGMMGSFLVIDTTATGISENNIENYFTTYPNPVSNFVSIEFQNEIRSAEIKLINVLGEIILSKQIENTENAKLNVSQLSNGIYFLQVKTNNKVFTQKIVKQ